MINKYIEVARFIEKYKSKPKFLDKYPRKFIFEMMEYFEIEKGDSDCENCAVTDWVLENDISEYLAETHSQSYLDQVKAFEVKPRRKRACAAC